MLVEVHNLDNGSGTNGSLDVYLSHNGRNFELKPFCKIDENDFCSLLNDKQYYAFCEGKEYRFRVNKNALAEKAQVIYPRY